MAQITLKSPAGKDAGNVDLDEALFGVQPNVPLMHQVVTAQLARRRAGSQSTKTRSEVRGGGAKPYRQKGTGNARQGSTNSPHYSGGGIAHGPKPRSYAQRTPKKMIKQALRSALSDRANDGKILVVDAWAFETPRTKDAAKALAALGLEGRTLVVIERGNATAALSFRNIPEVQIIQPGELNAYDVLCNDWIVFTQESLSIVEQGAAASAVRSKHAAAAASQVEEPAKVDQPAQAKKASTTKTVTDETESVTSSPDRSADETEPGVGSASDQPDASASELSAGSASEQSDTATVSPDRSTDETEAGATSASEKPDASASEQSAGSASEQSDTEQSS